MVKFSLKLLYGSLSPTHHSVLNIEHSGIISALVDQHLPGLLCLVATETLQLTRPIWDVCFLPPFLDDTFTLFSMPKLLSPMVLILPLEITTQ